MKKKKKIDLDLSTKMGSIKDPEKMAVSQNFFCFVLV